MPRTTAVLLLALAATWQASAVAAADTLSGRWEGRADIPGAPMAIVLDLDAHAGSLTLPGRGVSGAPLRKLDIEGSKLRASLETAIPSFGAAGPAPSLELERRADGRLSGQLLLGGLAAALTLERTGIAQVRLEPTSSPVSTALAGIWRGRYELGGYAREVTLTIAAGAPGAATLVIVGKRTTEVPIDRVVQGPAFLTVESSAMGLTIEGRYGTETIDATFQQGPFELPLLLQRQKAAS